MKVLKKRRFLASSGIRTPDCLPAMKSWHRLRCLVCRTYTGGKCFRNLISRKKMWAWLLKWCLLCSYAVCISFEQHSPLKPKNYHPQRCETLIFWIYLSSFRRTPRTVVETDVKTTHTHTQAQCGHRVHISILGTLLMKRCHGSGCWSFSAHHKRSCSIPVLSVWDLWFKK